ncbi:regulator of G-protein signaling 21-like [Polyodon spathula]|uniref:regulator of G-protein signaling 21-like n=1 Tax=Polyodon spathula TaxID=7913 RepID=UPI001B7DE537|nr:regulator of G-protein signaling 21-like [Polyodon spathula]
MNSSVKDGDAIFKGSCCFSYRTPQEEATAWSESVDKVLESKAGRVAFIEFLKSEFSEENILFWLACEEYKKMKSTTKMIERSKEIFLEYVKVGAPKEINIDCGTRENITRHISTPTLNSFDHAQKIIYSLLAKDCYPRFLKSDIYMAYCQQNER